MQTNCWPKLVTRIYAYRVYRVIGDESSWLVNSVGNKEISSCLLFQYLGKAAICCYRFRTDAGISSMGTASRSFYRFRLTATMADYQPYRRDSTRKRLPSVMLQDFNLTPTQQSLPSHNPTHQRPTAGQT